MLGVGSGVAFSVCTVVVAVRFAWTRATVDCRWPHLRNGWRDVQWKMAGGEIIDKIRIDGIKIKVIIYHFWWTLERWLLRHASREPARLHHGTAVVAAAVRHQRARALLEGKAN